MNRLRKSILSLILATTLTIGMFGGVTVSADEQTMTPEQMNAIAMLNYITILTQEINASKNSRVFLEEAYSSLINNTYPNAVDSRTLNQLTGLLDTMERYRMINVKRDRLQYIYEQSQAQAIRSAVPNPVGMISTVHSFNPAKLIGSIVYMAVDSYTSYTAYTAEAEQQYLKDGWALDDEEAKELHESRKGTFSYMVKMVNDYDLPGDLTLTEDTVEEFVKYKNSSNLVSRLQFLESNKNVYQSYGGYWLVLADSYYNNGDYQKCIDAVATYQDMGTRIFRRDYELAKVLPLAIAAANEVYSTKKYAAYASEQVQNIVKNSDNSDWALRYFAAQTLVDLYAETKDETYLESAYKIILDNVNYLVSEQKTLNSIYLSEIQEEKVPKDAEKDEKKQIENYNKMLKKTRKTELPPVFEPLMLNCDLLFAVSEELGVSTADKNKIDRLLHSSGDSLFLTKPIDNQYMFDSTEAVTAEDIDIKFSGETLSFPAEYLTKDAIITVTVTEPGNKEVKTIDDWIIDEVDRDKKEDVAAFTAKYTSKTAKKYTWVSGSNVEVKICPKDGCDISYEFEFETEGTKNSWFDHVKVWESSMNFVRVK